MITGFLELASPREMRGWAYDQAEPGAHLSVEVLCGARTIGRVQADLYRRDLEAAGVGQGDHAFVLRCDPALTEADLSLVSARVNCPGRLVHVLPWLVDAPERKLSLSPIAWPGPASDLEHHPVFILGAARSGTSAVAHALLAAAGYEGNEEGHLFDMLAPLAAGARRFDDSKADERLAGRNTTVARVPPAFIDDGLAFIAITAARLLFPTGRWLDKTPCADMVLLAPRFRQIWPNARFIFMKRRAIENIASRMRKFEFEFAHNCREWVSVMQAWLHVHAQLGSAAIELDQLTLAHAPDRAATEIARLLGLSNTEQRRVAQTLASAWPQRTASAVAQVKGIGDVGWSSEQQELFRALCGSTMELLGYGEGPDYYRLGNPAVLPM